MDFNATVDLIIRELEETVEIIEDLRNYQGVPSLQVELAKSKCRNAAEVIRLLKNIPGREPVVKQEPIIRPVEEKPSPVKPLSVISSPVKPEEKTGVRRQEPSILKAETPRMTKKSSETVTLADTFGQRTNSINEKLGTRKEDDGFKDIIKSKPITRLSEAIGINDRFLFIRELFQGNADLYNRTISDIENSSSFVNARAIIMDYAGNDEENEAARQLLDLVKRKFPGNE